MPQLTITVYATDVTSQELKRLTADCKIKKVVARNNIPNRQFNADTLVEECGWLDIAEYDDHQDDTSAQVELTLEFERQRVDSIQQAVDALKKRGAVEGVSFNECNGTGACVTIPARAIEDAVHKVVQGQRIPVLYSCRPSEVISVNGENYRVRDTMPNGVNAVKSSDCAPYGSNEPDRITYLNYDDLRDAKAYLVAVIVVVDRPQAF